MVGAISAGSATRPFVVRQPNARQIDKVRTLRYTESISRGHSSAYTVSSMSGLASARRGPGMGLEVTKMASRVFWSCRLLVAAMAALAIVSVAPTGAQARDTFDATGTVDSKNEDK